MAKESEKQEAVANDSAKTKASTKVEEVVEEEPIRMPIAIKYVGSADVKRLTAFDMGLSELGSDYLEWTSQNDFTVRVEDMYGPELEYLRYQPDFVVVYE